MYICWYTLFTFPSEWILWILRWYPHGIVFFYLTTAIPHRKWCHLCKLNKLHSYINQVIVDSLMHIIMNDSYQLDALFLSNSIGPLRIYYVILYVFFLITYLDYADLRDNDSYNHENMLIKDRLFTTSMFFYAPSSNIYIFSIPFDHVWCSFFPFFYRLNHVWKIVNSLIS